MTFPLSQWHRRETLWDIQPKALLRLTFCVSPMFSLIQRHTYLSWMTNTIIEISTSGIPFEPGLHYQRANDKSYRPQWYCQVTQQVIQPKALLRLTFCVSPMFSLIQRHTYLSWMTNTIIEISTSGIPFEPGLHYQRANDKSYRPQWYCQVTQQVIQPKALLLFDFF